MVDTACSSSLVALHYAGHSVRSGEATVALVGGVNLILAPETMVFVSKFGGLAPDGRCKGIPGGETEANDGPHRLGSSRCGEDMRCTAGEAAQRLAPAAGATSGEVSATPPRVSQWQNLAIS